jgi:hypothetical protein
MKRSSKGEKGGAQMVRGRITGPRGLEIISRNQQNGKFGKTGSIGSQSA